MAPVSGSRPTEPRGCEPGREATFDAIYQAGFPYVWRTLRRLGVRHADLEDVAHETLIVVWRRLRDYDPNRPLRPWLFGVALRVVQHYRRSLSPAPPDDVEEPSQQGDAEDVVAANQARRWMMCALGRLDLDRKTVFILHDLDGQAMPDVARMLGIRLNTAYSRLRLARNQIAADLRRVRVKEAGRC